MRLGLIFSILFSIFILHSCTQPIGNSLLVNPSNCDSLDSSCSNSSSTNNENLALSIQPNTSAVAIKMDDTDTVEISGSCQDLGRKKNRILVEVFAGEDESADPYISNSISDACYTSVNPVRSGLESIFVSPKSLVLPFSTAYTFTATGGRAPYQYFLVSGLGVIDINSGVYTSPAAETVAIVRAVDANLEESRAVINVFAGVSVVAKTEDKKCFKVTKGAGLVEDSGAPNEKTYPQCHNGQFGFSVRLGKILAGGVGQPPSKYTVRMKLRTQEGLVSDSPWTRVLVERTLNTPIITTAVSNVLTGQQCAIKSNASRFNLGLTYTLTRTFTDILNTNAGSTDLFANASANLYVPQSLMTISNDGTVAEWNNSGLIDGVTYNYTFTSTEESFGYASPMLATSSTVSCITKTITAKLAATATSGTCYLGFNESLGAPYNTFSGNEYEWGYTTTGVGWIGANGNTNAGYTSAACGNNAVCTQSGLVAGTNYFFAVRTKRSDNSIIGRWSNVVVCQPL